MTYTGTQLRTYVYNQRRFMWLRTEHI